MCCQHIDNMIMINILDICLIYIYIIYTVDYWVIVIYVLSIFFGGEYQLTTSASVLSRLCPLRQHLTSPRGSCHRSVPPGQTSCRLPLFTSHGGDWKKMAGCSTMLDGGYQNLQQLHEFVRNPFWKIVLSLHGRLDLTWFNQHLVIPSN